MSHAVFDLNKSIRLHRAANGGWVISQPSGVPGIMDVEVGAYSNADDMLADLQALSSHQCIKVQP